jgi:hypothetical protein
MGGVGVLPITSSVKVFDSPLYKDDIARLLLSAEDLINNFKGARLIEKTEKGYIIDVSFRGLFRSISERLVLTIHRSDESTINIFAVGNIIDLNIVVKLREMFPFTRIEITTSCKSENEKLCRKIIGIIEDSIEHYIRTSRKILEARREAVAKPVEKPVSKPVTVKAKAESEAEKVEAKPAVPTVSRVEYEKILEKISDPIFLANLLLKATLIKRLTVKMPSSIDEFRKNIIEPYRVYFAKYKLGLVSIRSDNTEIYVAVSPNTEIIAAYGVIKRVREIKGGEEMLSVLLEIVKNAEGKIRIWGINEVPEA